MPAQPTQCALTVAQHKQKAQWDVNQLQSSPEAQVMQTGDICTSTQGRWRHWVLGPHEILQG